MHKLTTSGLYCFENMKKKILNLTRLMLLNKLVAVVLNNILRDFAKSTVVAWNARIKNHKYIVVRRNLLLYISLIK